MTNFGEFLKKKFDWLVYKVDRFLTFQSLIVILCIIMGDVHQFIGHCHIPDFLKNKVSLYPKSFIIDPLIQVNYYLHIAFDKLITKLSNKAYFYMSL